MSAGESTSCLAIVFNGQGRADDGRIRLLQEGD